MREKLDLLINKIIAHKILTLVILLIIGIIVFMIGIYIAYKYKYNLFGLVGLIIIIIYAIIYFVIMFRIEKESFYLLLKLIGGIAIGIVMLYLIGFEVLNLSGMFEKNQKEMIGVYGSIFSGIISAGIGAIAAICGAKMGAKKSYEGAIDAVTKQIEAEKDKIDKQNEQNRQISLKIIEKFILNEINYNFSIISYVEKHLNNYDPKGHTAIPNNKFKFDIFNQAKFELIKYESNISDIVIDIYNKFFIISTVDKLENLGERIDEVKTIFNDRQKLKQIIENNQNKN